MAHQLKDIEEPNEHDVLSGRGNYVNFHPGNEQFRELVRFHKVAYVAAPKSQKPNFARLIVDEIRRLGGRFLKQDPNSKLWNDIGDKKSLDKTRQALREGAPDLEKALKHEDPKAPAATPKSQFASYGGMGTHVTAPFPSHPAVLQPDAMSHLSGGMHEQSSLAMDPVLKTQLEMEALQARLSALYPNVPVQQRTGYALAAQNGIEQQQRQNEPAAVQTFYAPRKDTSETDDDQEEEHSDDDSNISLELLLEEAKNRSWRKSSRGMSLGEITEEGNLSAMFDDSMRFSEDGLAKEATKVPSLKPGSKPIDKSDTSASIMGFDMSVATIGDVPTGYEGSSMNMSFTNVFDESDAMLTSMAPEKHAKTS